jgi:hypothetical protein
MALRDFRKKMMKKAVRVIDKTFKGWYVTGKTEQEAKKRYR